MAKRKIRHNLTGWIRDRHDELDFCRVEAPRELPPAVDLRDKFAGVPLENQGQLGSCVSNGVAETAEFTLQTEGQSPAQLARLFIYYNGRAIEGTVSQDSGLQVRDGMKAFAQLGAPPETVWPYVIAKFKNKPSKAAYAQGLNCRGLEYQRVTGLQGLKGALADGLPVVLGFVVYESFESEAVAKTGIVPMPKRGERILGGHCCVAVGYDDATQRVLLRNSWGNWGMNGYFTMPYAYFQSSKLSDDYWTLTKVGKP